MNTTQLEYLVAIVKYGGLREAAIHLYISPQALSKSISRLEQELGIKLFVKSGRGIRPTPSAILLSELSQDIIDSLKSLKHMVLSSCNADSKRGFTLGVTSTPYHGGLLSGQDVSLLEEAKPEIGLKIHSYSNGPCLEALREELIDAAVIVGRSNDSRFDSYKLVSLPLGFAMSASNPLASHSCITSEDIAAATIAEPINIKCVYPTLKSRLADAQCYPSITPVDPFFNDYLSFLRDGGLMLVHDNSPLIRVDDKIVFRNDETGLIPEVPYYFISDKLKKTRFRSVVLNELRKVVKRRSPSFQRTKLEQQYANQSKTPSHGATAIKKPPTDQG